MECAVQILTGALDLVPTTPIADCPFLANSASQLSEGESRIRAGLVDQSDFD